MKRIAVKKIYFKLRVDLVICGNSLQRNHSSSIVTVLYTQSIKLFMTVTHLALSLLRIRSKYDIFNLEFHEYK